jgi:hypothetical protein
VSFVKLAEWLEQVASSPSSTVTAEASGDKTGADTCGHGEYMPNEADGAMAGVS